MSSSVCTCRVRLVGSVPGTHKDSNMHKWGHLRLRKVCVSVFSNGARLFIKVFVWSVQLLSESGASRETVNEEWPVVGQFSSIGSLGPAPHSWLTSEWLLSLSTCRKSSASALHNYPKLQLVRYRSLPRACGHSVPISGVPDCGECQEQPRRVHG